MRGCIIRYFPQRRKVHIVAQFAKMEHRSSGPSSRGRACRYAPIATGRAQIFGCRLGGLDGGVGSERARIYTTHTIIAVIEHVQIKHKNGTLLASPG
jgi:hypothetical protein